MTTEQTFQPAKAYVDLVTRLTRSTEHAAAQPPSLPHPAIRLSRRRVIGIVSAVVLVAAASIGLAGWPASKAQAGARPRQARVTSRSARSLTLGSFGWLASTTPPATWARLTVPSGLGTLSSPPGFRAVDGDPGTLSLALLNSAGTYLGYLNVTPHQGDETLQDWTAFRLSHLRDDDAVSVHEDAAVQSVQTAAAVRSCIIDDYVTTVDHHHFHEVACYVTSGSVSSVVVAATPAGDPAHVWTRTGERGRRLSVCVARSPKRSRVRLGQPGVPVHLQRPIASPVQDGTASS